MVKELSVRIAQTYKYSVAKKANILTARDDPAKPPQVARTFSAKSMLKRTIALVLIASMLIGIATYYIASEPVARGLIWLNRVSASLYLQTPVTVGSHQVQYLAGGQGETVVLLHGIFAEKDHWVDFARPLTARYRIIAPDLPGFGESGRFASESYDYSAQVERLAAFLDAINVKRAHLAGNSMGGTIATLFALRYPDRVLSVGLIGAPHGINTPTASAMDKLIDAHQPSPLIAHNAREFNQTLDFLFKQQPFLPHPIKQRAQSQAIANAASNARLWSEQRKDRFLLDARIDQLKHPTLILWGDADQLFDVSGAAVLQTRLPHAEIQVLRNVGHLPMMETPGDAAKAYTAFLSRLRS
jgi:abhydrolase domain-containing protein 6